MFQSVFQLSMKSCEKVNYGSNNKINSYSIIYMGGLQSYNDGEYNGFFHSNVCRFTGYIMM